MSSKGRGNAESVESDWYATPKEATTSILEELRPVLHPSRILEPTAGKGAIVLVAHEFFPEAAITGIELDRARFDRLTALGVCAETWHGDFYEWPAPAAPAGFKPFDAAIMNPPFKPALSILERTLPLAVHTIALLRLGFLSSAERKPFWSRHPADIYPLASRPSFAASLKCVGTEKGKGKKKESGCGWAVIQELEAPRAQVCPQCTLGFVSVTTSDSADYMWAHFWPGAKPVRVL